MLLKNDNAQKLIEENAIGAVRKELRFNDLCLLKIPLPPITVQKEILGEIDNYQKIIDGAMQVVDNYEPTIKIDPNWQMIELEEILDYEQPTKYIVKSVDYDDKHKTPVLTAGKSFILGYTNEEKGVFNEKNLPVIIFDDFTTAIKFVNFPFKVKSSAMKILKPKTKKVNMRFVFAMMKKIKFNAGLHKRYYLSEYQKIKIPLPSLKIQEEIVSQIGEEQKIIEANKKLIKAFKQRIKDKISEIWGG